VSTRVKFLMAVPRMQVEELVNLVDEDRLVNDLGTMVATPSVNPFDGPVTEECREQEFANLYRDMMNDQGLDTFSRAVVEGRPNVFGRLSGTSRGPCIMLAGHLDTVGTEGYVDPFNPVVKNGRLHGRGSCDMKAALAAYIEVARIIHNEKIRLKGDLLLAGVVDEEHLMIGSREISRNGPIPDFAIVGEPTELKICHAHKGQLCMHIKTFGKASHSSVPENGINAISHMADVVKALDRYSEELKSRRPHPVCGHGRVNPGVIKGGTISSSVPDYCELEVDRRVNTDETREVVVGEYRQFLDRIARSNPEFRYEIGAPTLDNAALDTDVNSEIVVRIKDAYRSTLHKPADVGAYVAATDAPNFLCPAVICGPGSIRQAHTLEEYVEIAELTAAAKIYLRTVLDLLLQ